MAKAMNNKEIEYIQKNVAANLAIEDAYASEAAKEINKQFLKRKISSKEAINRIKKIYI